MLLPGSDGGIAKKIEQSDLLLCVTSNATNEYA
jgi:hypothetical protein